MEDQAPSWSLSNEERERASIADNYSQLRKDLCATIEKGRDTTPQKKRPISPEATATPSKRAIFTGDDDDEVFEDSPPSLVINTSGIMSSPSKSHTTSHSEIVSPTTQFQQQQQTIYSLEQKLQTVLKQHTEQLNQIHEQTQTQQQLQNKIFQQLEM